MSRWPPSGSGFAVQSRYHAPTGAQACPLNGSPRKPTRRPRSVSGNTSTPRPRSKGASPGSAIRQANAVRQEKEGPVIGSIWLHTLPDALEDLGNVTLFKGWENAFPLQRWLQRVDGHRRPSHGVEHVDANDTNYMWNNAPTKPVGAIYLARDGEVVIGAAGATNCAGKGGPLHHVEGDDRHWTRRTRTRSTSRPRTLGLGSRGRRSAGQPTSLWSLPCATTTTSIRP